MINIQHLAVIGCGKVGKRLVAQCAQRPWRLTCLVSSAESAGQIKQSPVTPWQADLDRDGVEVPTDADVYLYLVPPPGEGERDTRIQRFLQALGSAAAPRRVVYLSTTAVYGDCQGAWVDETRPPQPLSARGRRRRDAERQLQAWARQAFNEVVILRVGGIYGPGRLPLARLEKQLPVLEESQSPYVNRIHVDDLIQICLAAAEKAPSGEIYNVSDGRPGTMTDYFNRVADMTGLPRPPQVSWAEAKDKLTPQLLSYLQESRRLDNSKMLKQLGIQLRYPDLAAGLAASPDIS